MESLRSRSTYSEGEFINLLAPKGVERETEEDELADIDLRDPDLHKAASIIQSTFRRSKARQIQPAAAKESVFSLCLDCQLALPSVQIHPLPRLTEEDELADLDLNDPELHKAASKIQATFRKRMIPVNSSRPDPPQSVPKESLP
ncbi:hypothetical protein C0J52_16518 [Blattella germanica]|nr:hypothetical protein C0J52_16518 [Blattella germanica]